MALIYVEAFGHPRLRRKHLHFEIGNKERDQWLLCAQRAVNQLDVAGHIGEELMNNLRVMANHLRNQGTLGSVPQQYNGPDRCNVK